MRLGGALWDAMSSARQLFSLNHSLTARVSPSHGGGEGVPGDSGKPRCGGAWRGGQDLRYAIQVHGSDTLAVLTGLVACGRGRKKGYKVKMTRGDTTPPETRGT